MTIAKMLKAKVLTVNCRDDSDTPIGENSQHYSFEVLEFENGLILVPGDTTNDWFFEDREKIQASGLAYVTSVKEKNEMVEISAKALRESIQGSIREFGEKSVPIKHLQLWKKYDALWTKLYRQNQPGDLLVFIPEPGEATT